MAPGLPCPALALGLLALLLHGARSDCGRRPTLSGAVPPDTNIIESFPIGTEVRYRCLDSFVKIPGKADTVVCLSNSRWSTLEEFCDRSCGVPVRLKAAALNKEDEMKSYYPVGIIVRYTCRPGYENITEKLLVSTCLENITWSEVPLSCKRKSCGHPGELLHGRAVDITDIQFGGKVDFLCEDGYKLIGKPSIQCQLNGDEVEWSELPTCQMITCSPPPYIANGTYDARSVGYFAYNSTVTYKCNHGFQLIGSASINCTTKDKTSGIWSGLPPKCKGSNTTSIIMVPDQHLKKNRSKPYKPSQFQKTPFTITSHRSSSFPRGGLKPIGRRVTPLFRFALPLYVNQNYCSVSSKGRSVCHQSYMGISGVLPSTSCFKYLKWPEVPMFCGKRSWLSRRTGAWQSCCYNRLPIRCKSVFHP